MNKDKDTNKKMSEVIKNIRDAIEFETGYPIYAVKINECYPMGGELIDFSQMYGIRGDCVNVDITFLSDHIYVSNVSDVDSKWWLKVWNILKSYARDVGYIEVHADEPIACWCTECGNTVHIGTCDADERQYVVGV